jgi:hypothetical protein
VNVEAFSAPDTDGFVFRYLFVDLEATDRSRPQRVTIIEDQQM